MDKSAKQPEVIDAADFDPRNYDGRDVVLVKMPAEEHGIGREINFFGIRLRASIDENPAVVGVLGGGALGWELLTTRNTVGKMLMTDDEFAKGFRDGALQDIREKNLDSFTRYYSRESKVTQMIPDMINRYKLQWKVGSEVKRHGVGFAEAVRQWRFTHWLTVLGGAGASAWSVYEMMNKAEAKPTPEPQLQLDGSDWQRTLLKSVGHDAPGLFDR